VLAIIAAVAAFLVAALLTLSSIGKRVREIGTLKALGWSQRLVVRQVLGECLATGVAGGLVGVVLGVLAAAAIGAFGPSLSAELDDRSVRDRRPRTRNKRLLARRRRPFP